MATSHHHQERSDPRETGGGLDPYHAWLGKPMGWKPRSHYELLGIEPAADETTIASAANRLKEKVRMHEHGPHGRLAQRLLAYVQEASDCLLTEAKRKEYDRKHGFLPPDTTALRDLLADQLPGIVEPTTAPPQGQLQRMAERVKRHPIITAISGGALAALSATLYVATRQRGSEEEESTRAAATAPEFPGEPPATPPAPPTGATAEPAPPPAEKPAPAAVPEPASPPAEKPAAEAEPPVETPLEKAPAPKAESSAEPKPPAKEKEPTVVAPDTDESQTEMQPEQKTPKIRKPVAPGKANRPDHRQKTPLKPSTRDLLAELPAELQGNAWITRPRVEIVEREGKKIPQATSGFNSWIAMAHFPVSPEGQANTRSGQYIYRFLVKRSPEGRRPGSIQGALAFSVPLPNGANIVLVVDGNMDKQQVGQYRSGFNVSGTSFFGQRTDTTAFADHPHIVVRENGEAVEVLIAVQTVPAGYIISTQIKGQEEQKPRAQFTLVAPPNVRGDEFYFKQENTRMPAQFDGKSWGIGVGGGTVQVLESQSLPLQRTDKRYRGKALPPQSWNMPGNGSHRSEQPIAARQQLARNIPRNYGMNAARRG